ncbi:MAG: alpha-amylase family protein [Chitinophagia bacterium]
MNLTPLHQFGTDLLATYKIDSIKKDSAFSQQFLGHINAIENLFDEVYAGHPRRNEAFEGLLVTLIQQYKERADILLKKDAQKSKLGHWYLSNEITGMSLYVDRFSDNLQGVKKRLDYFKELGVNFLHLMPIFESPEGESDGGYAVSDFRKVASRFGNLQDLQNLIADMNAADMYLMLDIVLNHTSHHHEWAQKAKAGDPYYQDFYYFYDDRSIPNQLDQTMPEIFPESSPGSFSYVPELNKWVMTVFHHYQWDLNFSNPAVLVAMMDTILFYANLGVDILRIDAPAFIWKELGTGCQNLPKAHTLLRLIKQCTQVASPGMALLGEAIVAPKEIIKYFGTEDYVANECDVAYNATQMALQWDALATGDTRIMLTAQHDILQKPFGCTWISYTRCHDDIGLGYDDEIIASVGFNPYHHRTYLKNYYSGNHDGSFAAGALFSVNPKTNDARISGSLASLCGLEKALDWNNAGEIENALRKIILMQAHTMFMGGIPMLYYGDEVAYTNDYSYLNDPGKSYDNRWMHRPMIDWNKNDQRKKEGSFEYRIFNATKQLIQIRKALPILSDLKNITWMTPHNIHVAGFVRTFEDKKLYCLFNYQAADSYVTWYTFKEHGLRPAQLKDHWTGLTHHVGNDNEYFILGAYEFAILEMIP